MPRKRSMPVAAKRYKERTHCHRGHEYNAENTYYHPRKPNARRCRKCANERSQIARTKAKILDNLVKLLGVK